MKTLFTFTLFMICFSAFIFSCKKDNNANEKFCWQLTDGNGINMNQVCDKTEAYMAATYPNSCQYFKVGPEFCWLVNDSIFVGSSTEARLLQTMRCYGGMTNFTYSKVSCDYCMKWYHRLKKTYKPNNTFTYSETRFQTYCGDTAKTLFQGRQIIERETADSLIVRQFSNNGTNW